MSATAPLVVGPPLSARSGVVVDIVVPVYNEALALGASISRLHAYLTDRFPLGWQITIVDNASNDGTWAIACRLAEQFAGVCALHLEQKGRGRALRTAWTASAAPVVAYMDVDLSTDLDALLPLVAPLVSGHSDIAIGTRLAPNSRVVRGPKRELISRTYNLLLKATLHNGFSDAQCGFKAMRTDVARALLPQVEDEGWFFDTEILVLAEHNGLRIHEVPVDWVDDPDSRVDLVKTAAGDLRGVGRMLKRLMTDDADGSLAVFGRLGIRRLGRWLRYATVSVGSTALSMTLLGVLLATGATSAGWANVIATSAGVLPSFECNRRWVWRHRERSIARHLVPYAAFSFVGLALSTLTVRAANTWATHAGLATAPRALAGMAANVAVFGSLWLLQYVLLDRLLFATRDRR